MEVPHLEQFEETVASEKGYLSFVFMAAGQKNVDRAKLVKIELGDGSFSYEIELV